MYRLVTILLVLGLTAMPFQAFAQTVCGCSSPIQIAAFADTGHQETAACCVAQGDQNNPIQPDPKHINDPCDEGDCPLPCCGIANTLAGFSVEAESVLFHLISKQICVATQATHSSPHISRLKRPPRPTTTT